ncbi:ABC-type transport auxiliary lipoprotein family protein [Aurantiacibacter spongiae]|nr:ABC-type transport auxiliary lipoprotein family protein [Aurantiacibacter spongiae]
MTIRTSILGALAACAALSGCISFGPDAPDQLLTLTPNATIPAGASADGSAESALAVQTPAVSQRLNVTRVPVMTSDSSLAYLQDAVWVEKPAELFRDLLSDTIRAKGNRMVIGGGELDYVAQTQLSGELVDMGYDAVTGSVVVRYDAILRLEGGRIITRRFEASVPGIAPEAVPVGAALNEAANSVADQVAEWVG